jgi:hypothetical protein
VKYLWGVVAQSVAQTEDVTRAPDQLALTVGPLRKFVRSIDKALEAADSMAKVGAATSFETVAVANALSRWNSTLASIYSSFFESREGMYRVAAHLKIPTKRFSKKGAKSDAASASNEQLESEIASLASGMTGAIKAMADQGAKVLKDAEALSAQWAKVPPQESDPAATELVNAYLDFRDMASVGLFARMAGLMKRLNLRAKRVKRKVAAGPEADGPDMKAGELAASADRPSGPRLVEAADTKPPWSSDPELGGAEL